jgi:DNA-packaging protein gp3
MSNSMEANEGRDEKGRFTEKNLWSIARKRVGQPKKYPTPEELAFTALEYFDWCAATKNKITMAGLRVYVNFSRQDWLNYKTNYPDYFDTMNTIELLLEAEWEAKLGWAGSTQGAIFWLKNKAQWRDETTQHQTLTNVTASFGNTLQSAQQPTEDTSGDKQ